MEKTALAVARENGKDERVELVYACNWMEDKYKMHRLPPDHKLHCCVSSWALRALTATCYQYVTHYS
jgi:hypothetical protein